MDTSFKDFIDNILYHLLFDRIDQIFPEFNFKKRGHNWVSNNNLKVTGETGDKVGAVIVYHDRPYYFKDYTRGGRAITTYLVEQGKAKDWTGAVRYLADSLGLEIPNNDPNGEDQVKFRQAEKRASLFEVVNDFFIDCLSNKDNEVARSSQAERARSYLRGRGFTEDMLRTHFQELEAQSNKAEIGLVPSFGQIKKHLESKMFSSEEVDNLLLDSLSSLAVNRVTIPLRDPIGRVKGFAFRSVGEEGVGPKYLYAVGLDKSSLLFNLKVVKGDKDLVIVEGLIDALHARALGLDNVVALGGTSFNPNQIKLAQRYGAEKLTLCLDNDKAGIEATMRAIDLIKKTSPNLKLYIASLPQGIKDPDELITKSGIDALKTVIKEAQSYLGFHLDITLSRFTDNTDKGRDEILEDFRRVSYLATSPVERELVLEKFINKAEPLGITRKALDLCAERIKSGIEREREAKRIEKTLSNANTLLKEGKLEGVNELLGKHSKQNNTAISEGAFSELLKPVTEREVSERLKLKPEGLPSGYTFKGEELLIPSGAITILSAPTSHGKTSFLINLALSVAKKSQDIKPIHFFSYEENQEAIILKALNTFSNTEISKNNRRSIEAYLRDGSEQFFNRETREAKEKIALFKQDKEKFFNDYLVTRKLNFHYVSYSVEELVSAIHYLNKADEVGAVFIDYMQLLRLKNHKASSRQEELKQICLDLKDCSVKTGIPLILGAQFNRTVIKIEAIHPTAIGEAGDIERIANLIIGFWNRTFNELDKESKPLPEIYAKILKGRDIGSGAEESFDFNGNTGKIANKIPLVKSNLF